MNESRTILIVDDSAAGRKLLDTILKKDGYHIEFASDGPEALQKALEIKPDLMLLDVILPGKDGFEVCRAIRSNPYTSLMPIIIITALNDRPSKLKALRLGADEFLSKPLDAFEVRARVATVLKLDRFRRLLYDPVTGLPNETLFIDYIDHIMIAAKDSSTNPFAVLAVRLNNAQFLKNYLSHRNNQGLFTELIRIFHAGNPNVKIISYHRDGHFVVLLEGAGRNEAEEFAAEILKTFQSPVKYPDGEILLACKFGIALYPDDGDTGSELVENAQTAYREKTVEYGQIVFYDENIREMYRHKAEIGTHLFNAAQNGEFVLHFQPQIKLKNREIVAMEALVRWDSERYGFSFPDFFIGLAEENGTILKIGHWVIRESLRYLAELSAAHGIDAGMAINVSALQFGDPGFEEKFIHYANRYRIAPEKIKIEITESAIMAEPEEARKKMMTLKESGFRISIDDFGTGYASLVYLKNYPVDEIKLDKEFIRSIDSDSVNYNIAKYMIELAHTLNLEVVAEGVEDEKQLDLLQRLGCDMAQGYYFSKPVEPGGIVEMIINQPFKKSVPQIPGFERQLR